MNKKRKPIPTKEQNPAGLHLKYRIQKFSHYRTKTGQFGLSEKKVPVFKPIEPGSEYFVLRLDTNGDDPVHIAACRKAILVYADEINDHIPQLSKDLIERYGK